MYFKLLPYICIRKRNKLNPKTRKGTKIMKTTASNTYSNYNKVQSIKASKRNWDHIVLVKNGDFFEAYEQDADQISGICGIGQFNRKGCLLNIAGFHKDQLPYNLPKLLRAGREVSIWDQKA